MPTRSRINASHWQDWVNLLLGGWLFVSPWVLGYADLPAPAWNSWVLGVVVAAISVAALIQFAQWEEWVNAILGLWLLISPWVMGFAQDAPAALWNHVLLGIVVAALAIWDVLRNRERVTA